MANNKGFIGQSLFKWENSKLHIRSYNDLSILGENVESVCNPRHQTYTIRPYVKNFGSLELVVEWFSEQIWFWEVWVPKEDADFYWEVAEYGGVSNSRSAKREALMATIKRSDITQIERKYLEKYLNEIH